LHHTSTFFPGTTQETTLRLDQILQVLLLVSCPLPAAPVAAHNRRLSLAVLQIRSLFRVVKLLKDILLIFVLSEYVNVNFILSRLKLLNKKGGRKSVKADAKGMIDLC
jgi:hypothetical protein